MANKVKLEIRRTDGSKHAVVRYDSFEVEYDDNTTLMDAFHQIKARHDPSLAFRSSCKSDVCGSCAIKVDGIATLACSKRISDLKTHGTIRIDPLTKKNVIRDLIIDETNFWHYLEKVYPYLMRNKKALPPQIPGLIDCEQTEDLDNATMCNFCGACFYVCSVKEFDKGFLGPHAYVKQYRFIGDPRDDRHKKRLKLLDKNGLWNCSHCFLCDDVCPKGVMPSVAISKLRNVALETRVSRNKGAELAKMFDKHISKWGTINEASFISRTRGAIKSIEYVPLFLSMLIRKKLLLPIPKKIASLSEVKKLASIIKVIKKEQERDSKKQAKQDKKNIKKLYKQLKRSSNEQQK